MKTEDGGSPKISNQLFSFMIDSTKNGWPNYFLFLLRVLIIIISISIIIFLILKSFGWLFIKEGAYNIYKVEALGNAIYFKTPDKDIYSYSFPTSELWAGPDIEFKEGDEITITASGKYNSAVHHLVSYSHSDTGRVYPWIGPEGISKSKLPRKADKHRFKCAIDTTQNFGALLARTRSYKNNADKEIYHMINNKIKIKFLKPGYIEFAVNEPILTKERKEYYLITKDIDPQYERKRRIKYQKKAWDILEKSSYLEQLWFDDNVGQLFIIISKDN